MMLVMMTMMIIMSPEGSQGAETKAHFFYPRVGGTLVVGWVGGLVWNASQRNAMQCNGSESGINLTGLLVKEN